MVRSILQLFGKSPFGPLQSHMRKVHECAAQVSPLFEALLAGDQAKVEAIAADLSRLEHEADQIKNGIRANLPKSIFLPVDRGDLLDLLGVQDAIADIAEDLGILMRMRPLPVPASLKDLLRTLVGKATAVTDEAHRLMEELDELVEASFSGPEAERVMAIIDRLGVLEHECDLVQWQFARAIFAIEDQLSAGELWMWLKLGNKLGDLANAGENVGKRLSLMLHK
jgi:predicted phosphate transport protein (TIGR00153 family)